MIPFFSWLIFIIFVSVIQFAITEDKELMKVLGIIYFFITVFFILSGTIVF